MEQIVMGRNADVVGWVRRWRGARGKEEKDDEGF